MDNNYQTDSLISKAMPALTNQHSNEDTPTSTIVGQNMSHNPQNASAVKRKYGIKTSRRSKPSLTAPKSGQNIFRVGNAFIKEVLIVDKDGEVSTSRITITRQTLLDDFGNHIIKEMKKYDGWCMVPDNINYEPEINGFRNLYEPMKHIPVPGDWKTTEGFLNHVFGDQYELGLDYLQLLYLDPCQLLPVLCLVSKENQTGKTTFGNWLSKMFCSNACIIGQTELTSDFNASYASKLVIVVDESKIEKKHMDRIKSMSTASDIHERRMYQESQQIKFFGKFILLSNHETDFIFASDSDIRFWVRKLYPVDFDPDFDNQLNSELPAFLHFLKNRQYSTSKQSRMWFSADLIATKELEDVRKESRSWITKEIAEGIIDHLNNNSVTECFCTAGDLKKMLFANNSAVGISDIRKSLKDDLGLEPSKKTIRYHFPIDQIAISKPGKPYLLKTSDFE